VYEALIATIKKVYPDVHYDNLGFVFPPYVIIPVAVSIFNSKRKRAAVGLKLIGIIQLTI
jgi:hypothetical protein